MERTKSMDLLEQQYLDILENTVTDSHIVDNKPWPYPARSRKSAPRWSEVAKYRALVLELLLATGGLGMNQKRWEQAVRTFSASEKTMCAMKNVSWVHIVCDLCLRTCENTNEVMRRCQRFGKPSVRLCWTTQA